jgi:signal transduction histidine kinase
MPGRSQGRVPRASLQWQLGAALFALPLLMGLFLHIQIERYGGQIVDASSSNVMRKARDDLFGRIGAYLSLPESVVRLDAALAADGTLPIDDEGRLGPILLDQVLRERSVDFLYYANEAGGMISVGRDRDRYVIARTPGMKQGELVVDQVDAAGRLLAHDKVVHGFDPGRRDWYRSAKESRKVYWAKPYAGTFRATLAVSTAHPVIGPSGEVLGVVGADILLDTLASYLRSLGVSPHGRAFLVEPDGALVATSTDAVLFERRGEELVRASARESRDPLVREAARMVERASRTGDAGGSRALLRDASGSACYVDVSRYRYGDSGIEWYLVLAVPRSDITQPLDALVRRLVLISLFAVAAAMALSWGLGNWITRPILSMREQVKAVAGGRYGQLVTVRRADEIGELARSFNEMSTRLAAISAENARLLSQERGAREAAEEAQRRSAFLAGAGALLASSLDYEETLTRLSRLCVQSLADWCVLDLVEGRELRRLAGACHDPSREPLLEKLRQRHPARWDSPHPAARSLREGEPLWIPAVTDEVLRSTCEDEEHLDIIRGLGTQSAVVVPLVARGETLGVLSLASATPGRYGRADLELVKEVAHRAASAIDNARLYREIQRADQRKSEFIAVLSHELRNPLAPIRTCLQLLRRSPPDSPIAAQARKIMERQTEHLTRLVDDLLDITRISHSKIEIHRTRVDLREVVHSTCDDLRPVFERAQVAFNLALPPSVLWVEVDGTRVAQVVGNLLQNAAKFTPAGGRVTVEVAASGGCARISVRDDGIGMEPGEVERMFEPFAQAEQGLARKHGGLGLGLALAKGLVELHGGSIQARSEGPGCGSEFTVLLPLAGARGDEMAATGGEGPAIGADTSESRSWGIG